MKRSNSAHFALQIQAARESQQLTPADVYEAAKVPLEIQAQIEKGAHTALAGEWLQGYDRIFGWPQGYAAALAEMNTHQLGPVSDALRGGVLDERASQEIMQDAPADVWKTFAGLADDAKPYPVIGFNAATGDPVLLEGPILTNVGLKELGAMTLARSGHTTVDMNLTCHGSDAVNIATGYRGQKYRGAAENGVDVYATGVDVRFGKSAVTNIGVDPLIGLRSFAAAKALAAALLELRAGVRTTVMRAALTFFAAAKFDDEPLNTLIQLKRAQTPGSLSPAGRKRFQEFTAYWDEHFLTLDLGWDAAQPDPAAAELLAGVVASRDMLVDVDAKFDKDGTAAVSVVGPEQMLERYGQRPSVLFYDSAVAPELPLALHHYSPAIGLVFHSATLDRPRLGVLEPHMFGTDPLFVSHSVGITDSEDHAILSRYQGSALGTLTNYHHGQAIYCNSMGAQRIWIPTH